MSGVKAQHPDWALAYILQDWKKRGRKTLNEAYDAHCAGSGVSAVERQLLLDAALQRMRVYVAALEECVASEAA